MTATVKVTTASVGVTKKVAWPPKEEFDNPKVNDGMGEIISSAAKKYVRNVESTQSEQHGQYTLSRELFQPGKFKSDEIWKPNQLNQNNMDNIHYLESFFNPGSLNLTKFGNQINSIRTTWTIYIISRAFSTREV